MYLATQGITLNYLSQCESLIIQFQAIVDKNAAVASAALVSSLHVHKKSPEVVRRWANEVQEAVSSDRLVG